MIRAKLVGGMYDGKVLALKEEVAWLDVQGKTYAFSRLIRDDLLEYVEVPLEKKNDRDPMPEIGEDAASV